MITQPGPRSTRHAHRRRTSPDRDRPAHNLSCSP
jgi:hypothetical protein